MHRGTCARPVGTFMLLLALAACGGGGSEDPASGEPAKPTLQQITRFYDIYWHDTLGNWTRFLDPGFKDGFGVISERAVLSDLVLGGETTRPDQDAREATLFSSEDGSTYWVTAQGLQPTPANRYRTGSASVLSQNHHYRKDVAGATLDAVITELVLEGNSAIPVAPGFCPFPAASDERGSCLLVNEALVRLSIQLLDDAGNLLQQHESVASLYGWQSEWTHDFGPLPFPSPIWGEANFDWKPDFKGDGGMQAILRLKAPITFNIPLDKVPTKAGFWVDVSVEASAKQGFAGEFYMGAFFRDPMKSGSVSLQHSGLTPTAPSSPHPDLQAVPLCTTAPVAAAGTLQFETARITALEHAPTAARIRVTRRGGSQGDVSVDVTSQDGTATAGSDYTAIASTVRFADGEQGTRLVVLPILNDDLIEDVETVTLKLGNLRGCAALGASDSAVVSIHDTDKPPPATYSLGGTVTGLAGSGLTVSSGTGESLSPGNGSFTFPTALANGTAYDVRVTTQPSNPIQTCSVTNGKGTIGASDVADVVVACTTPLPNGALDPSFGNGGKVTSNSIAGARAMALQSDGKLVLLSSASKLARYNADGTQDMGFGTQGVVSVFFNNAADTARGLALQSDGKIVVVGRALQGTFDDFGVARFNGDGSLDTGFGNGGKATVDLNLSFDEAWVPLIQSDGRIVVVGNGGTSTTLGVDLDFAAVRLTADGALDTTFGSGGKVRVNIGGRADLVSSAALRPDGGIVIAGRAGIDGGALPDAAVVRLSASGAVEDTLERLQFTSSSDHDEATGVAVQSDGRVVLALNVRSGGVYRHALARLNTDGTQDGSFGTGGLAIRSFAVGGDYPRAIAIQPDGRIVTAGYTRPSTTQTSELDDFLVTRHNADGSLDTSFGDAGKLTVDFFAASDGAECVVLQPDGKIVAAGLALNGTTRRLALIRVLP